MVTIKDKFAHLANGEVDLNAWFEKISAQYPQPDKSLIFAAAQLANESSKGLTTFYGQPCIEQGLEMAETILSLKMDPEAVSAAIMLSTLNHTNLPLETVDNKLTPNVAKLLMGLQQMNAIHQLRKSASKSRDATQMDRMRKLLLAMVSDIRVVLITLAERLCVMRGIKAINPAERKAIAEETHDIYAPLANRLGVGQLKWELEDIAFHYSNPAAYKQIAKFLAERRVDRENQIHIIIDRLNEKLKTLNIHAQITGRAKHIYSIFAKAQRKEADYKDIYDYSAIRVLVQTVEECYTALSIIHNKCEHLPKEFDDYISAPKPNGYRSIHTAIIGPEGKIFEIQIRTVEMHEEAELGFAAHWLYKEGKSSGDYHAKVVFLRQLLDWHKDVAKAEHNELASQELISDRVYVFTPAGDILDLPAGATPLDAAYHIHSEVGNHCKGAKINGHIVPLTYNLRTSDQIEILTNPNGTPSRDWLNADFGYINTPRARAKISHWFRQLDLQQHIESGRKQLEKEFKRLNVQPNLQKLAAHFDLKDEDVLMASLGRGNLRLGQITHFLETQETASHDSTPLLTKRVESKGKGMHIAGVSDLLTRIARCCKPIPGDEIVGFITQGSGVTIHKKNCNNVSSLQEKKQDRLIAVEWNEQNAGSYYVDLQIRAHAHDVLLKEITTLLGNAKIGLISFNSSINRNNLIIITLTVQISALSQLNELIKQICHLPGVIEATRIMQ